jgi:hypothetical protein
MIIVCIVTMCVSVSNNGNCYQLLCKHDLNSCTYEQCLTADISTTAATDISIRVVHEQKCAFQNTNRTESSYNYRHAAVESNAHYSSTQNISRLESF